MAEALQTAIRFKAATRQKLERELGYSRGYLSKILNGTVEMRVRHVFEILGVLGIEPWEFFQLAYPAPAYGKGKKAAAQTPSVRAAPLAPADDELDERIRKGLLKLLMGIRA
jgi:transcriptional regulator with XRE-family HTH domain